MLTNREVMYNIINTVTGDRDLWDLITFLRGPDVDVSSLLKKYTTARVRSVLGFEMGAGRYYITHPSKLSLEERCRRDKFLIQRGNLHFIKHYEMAVRVIRDYYHYDLELEKEVHNDK